MKISGSNKYFGLGEKSNTDIPFEPCISPPLLSHINISALRSYSIFDNHAVMITKSGQAFAIGSNENGQIISTISKKIYKREQQIEIIDHQGNACEFISAVCGHNYTLYLVTSDTTPNNQLVYVNSNHNTFPPLFLNINGRNPTHLFGGWKTAAALDSEDGIFVITEAVFSSPNHSIKRSFLPKGEKAISIACCNSFIVVASSTGRVFGSSLENLIAGRESRLDFSPVSELEGEEIVEVSGTVETCLAINRKGQIFGLGSNEWGQIGLGFERTLTSKFTQILALRNFNVVSASAGCFHSLFVTSQGKVLASGNNGCGQLAANKGPCKDFAFLPVESTINKGCSFCIAGNNVSAFFVECEPPKNTPNRAVRVARKTEIVVEKRKEIAPEKKGWIDEQADENVRLKKENFELKKTIEILRQENEKQAEKIRQYEEKMKNIEI